MIVTAVIAFVVGLVVGGCVGLIAAGLACAAFQNDVWLRDRESGW